MTRCIRRDGAASAGAFGAHRRAGLAGGARGDADDGPGAGVASGQSGDSSEASAGEPLIVGFNVGAGAEKTVLIRAGYAWRLRGEPAAARSAGSSSSPRKCPDGEMTTMRPPMRRFSRRSELSACRPVPRTRRWWRGSRPAAHLDVADGATGTRTALVEVYEWRSTGTPLTNLSARTRGGHR
jgi:hypothetical protein